jgi:RNA polymerase sigma-70 factor (ECF subfamily)
VRRRLGETHPVSRSTGKAAEFLELLRPLQRQLEVYCRRLLRDRTLVEDVIQAAVAEAFAKFDRYVEGTNFRAWIFRFVTHQILNQNRKATPLVPAEGLADLPSGDSREEVGEATFAAMLEDPDVVLEHFDDAVARALGQLPPLERAALLLRSVGGFSYEEIHQVLAIPLGSVIGYLSRARSRLRTALADYAVRRGLLPRNPRPQRPEP